MIDMASVYAERFKQNPQMLQAAVMGQSPDPKLDPYTALNALRLIKEANMMAMAGKAQQPTSSPSIVAETMAPVVPQGLGAMVPGAMGQAPRPPQPPQPQARPQPSGGLAAMPTPEREFAAGGIVAFSGKDESLVDSEDGLATLPPGTPYNPTETGIYVDENGNLLDVGEGNPDLQRLAARNYLASRKAIADSTDEVVTPEDLIKYRKQYLQMLKDESGPDIYGPALARLGEREKAQAAGERQDTGLALIAAAGRILKGRNLAEGVSEAAPGFARDMAEASRAAKAEQRSIEQMQFYYADAQRKERKGDLAGAQAAAESYRKAKQDAAKNKFSKNKALADIDVRAMQATRPLRGATGSGPKVAEQLAAAEIAFANNPTQENRRIVEALRSTVSQTKTSWTTGESGPGRLGAQADVTQANIDKDIDALVNKKKWADPEWKDALGKEDSANMAAAERRIRKDIIASRAATTSPKGKPSDGGVNKNSTIVPNISTIQGAPKGSRIGSNTAQGWEILDSSGTLIGYAK